MVVAVTNTLIYPSCNMTLITNVPMLSSASHGRHLSSLVHVSVYIDKGPAAAGPGALMGLNTPLGYGGESQIPCVRGKYYGKGQRI